MHNLDSTKTQPFPASVSTRPTSRSLIHVSNLQIGHARIDDEKLLIDVKDKLSGRKETLVISPLGGIRHVPSKDIVRTMIMYYIKYDLISQEQFIALSESGKQDYLNIMVDSFYPYSCSVWMKTAIEYIQDQLNLHDPNYSKFSELNKTIQQWAFKEKTKRLSN